ncbi:MAG: hypothetical protein NT062_21230 [Proteobacteria bacterium]|nr:hypothetical protein [Pseudomonadota bacterium]
MIPTVAGTGAIGFSGDGGPAIAATLDSPLGVAVDEAGALYIADSYNAVVRKVAGGTISTIAGTTALGNTGDGGPATAARLTTPARIAIAGGVLVVADADTQSVRRIDATGTITTIAGTGTGGYGGDGGPAIAAQLAAPQGVALDPMGGVYIADTQNFRVRRIDAAGAMSTVAGTGEFDDVGDGGVATAGSLLYPRGIAIDPVTETVYIADTDHHRIRKVAPDGTISTVAGNGMVGTGGDGGPATAAQVSSPIAVAIAANGELFIAEPTRIRKVDAAGVITTLATGLGFVSGIAAAGNGSAIFSDRDANVVQRVTAAGTITTIVGVGTAGFSGDGGDALLAELRSPDGVFVDGADLVIADTGNRCVRRVSSANTITTIAGDGSIVMGGVTGDGGPAIAASLYPYAAVVAGGELYIADGLDYRVRRVTGGTISTIAGTGVEGARGDGGAGADARVGFAFDVAAANGAAYVVDNSTFRVRKIASTGAITTFAGRVDPVGAGPRDRATLVDPRALVETPDGRVVAGGTAGVVQRVGATAVEIALGRYQQEVPTANLARYRDATFGAVTGLAYDPTSQHLYVAESGNNRIDVVTMVDPRDASTWTIAPLANAAGTNGATDGPALTAQFRSPSGLYYDAATRALYVADTNNHLIRRIDLSTGEATATVSTIAGTTMTPGFAGDGGAATGAQLDTPRALAGCPNGDLYVADTNNHRVRRIAAGGAISTVLGDGTDGTMGEGIPATTIPAGAPRGVACDASGNVFVTTTETVRYLPADATSHVVDGAGEAQTIFGRDRTTFPASASDCLTGIMVTAGPVLHVVDACAGTLVELRP